MHGIVETTIPKLKDDRDMAETLRMASLEPLDSLRDIAKTIREGVRSSKKRRLMKIPTSADAVWFATKLPMFLWIRSNEKGGRFKDHCMSLGGELRMKHHGTTLRNRKVVGK